MKDKNNKKNALRPNEWDQSTMFGSEVSFAVSEAYKLLRTNIMFSFSSESRCHVIGVMSSVRGEGKSTTACNLAYALTEAGKRTLLMEADLRLPSISEKLELKQVPGLTNLLVSNERPEALVQHCKAAPKMEIITAGSSTPNPSELLGSTRMKELVADLSKSYEFIVVDLPPVTAVSDALAISKLLDGVIMVVRSNLVTRKELAETMRQLKLVGVRILGFAYRNSGEGNESKYARKYGRRYYRRSGYDYAPKGEEKGQK